MAYLFTFQLGVLPAPDCDEWRKILQSGSALPAQALSECIRDATVLGGPWPEVFSSSGDQGLAFRQSIGSIEKDLKNALGIGKASVEQPMTSSWVRVGDRHLIVGRVLDSSGISPKVVERSITFPTGSVSHQPSYWLLLTAIARTLS